MYYFLHGDISKAIPKAQAMVGAMLKKQPDASHFKIDTDHFSVAELQELIGGQGLFAQKYIVDLRRLCDDEQTKSDTLSFIKELQASPNIFIWVEETPKAADLKKIEKYAEKVQVFAEAKQKETKPAFNIFSLADALGERNKKKLWMLYTDALQYFQPEELYGNLFWQIKSILLTFKTKDAKEAGLNPFVYSKAKKFAQHYSQEEVEMMSLDLLSLYHDARAGKHDFGIALERFCLGV